MQWGSRGTGPGELAVAHAIEIDSEDRLYVADRENFRVQIFVGDFASFFELRQRKVIQLEIVRLLVATNAVVIVF